MHAILFITLIAVSFFAATVTSYADGPIRDVPDWPEDLPTPYGHADRVPHDGLSTYVLFSIDKTGATKVLGAKPGHHPVSPCRVLQDRHINDDSTYVLVHYKHPVDGLDCHIPISDPRKMYHDHDAGDHKFGGGIMHHDEAEFAISLHPDASDVTVSDFVTKIQTMHKVTQDHHRAFEAMDNVVTIDATKVVPTTIQIVGSMSRQKNIIFLSSGYTASQQSKFDTDVTTLLDFMQLPTNDFGVSSQPYLRYFSLFNIFKVWYPSNAVGASHPAPAGDGTSVDNNLGCSYGASSYRILTCTRAKVLLLGSYAPPDATNALYIILVNDVLFGGTGGSGVCSIYTGAKMPVVFIHEVGHASTGLSDEYNYGTTETSQVPLLNCYWSNAQTPWQGWILAGILPSPSPVCTYTNYYKPTPSTCLMESDNSAMCPVCGEAVLEHIYDVGLDLTAPRYPGPYETLVLVNGESFPLTISSKIPYRRDETGTFTTTWTVGDTVLTRGVHQLGVARQNTTSAATTLNVSTVWYYPGPGSYTITVTILDNTNIFLSSTRNTLSAGTNISSIRQVHEFRILVVADEATRSAANCSWRNSSTLSTGGYCTQCDAGHASDCSLSFSSRPLQYALDVTASLGSLQTWLLGVGGVFIIMGFIVFFLIWKSMQLQSQTRVREVLPLTEGVKRVRWVLMGTQCFMLLGTTVVIFFSVYMYSVMTVFGKTIIIGIIVTSCIVWAVSFLGFCAAYYKNRIVLFVNFALLLVLFGCALLFTLLLAYVLLNIDTPAVQDQLHTEWQNSVSNNPYDVCTLQSVLDCSGFNTSCYAVNTVVGTNDCPANCETGNLIAYPCWLRIRSFVLSQFLYATFAGGALSVFLLLCMILGLILGCKIKTQKMETNLRRKQRQARGENALTPEEVEMLLVEFKKIDKDNSGDISREEFGGFYNDVMGTALTQRQLDEYFDKLDSDGSGSLSFEEFVKIYRPIKKPKKRSLKEAQEARELARTQSESFVIPDDSNKALTPAASSIGFGGATPGTANSQRSDRGAMIDLDLQLDDDIDLFMDDEGDLGAMAHAAEEQEKAAREQAAAVAAAQAERQKRHALEQPAAVDVSNVLGDLANDLGGGGDDFGDFENMDLEIDLDNDMY